jgi:hypothetical protein
MRKFYFLFIFISYFSLLFSKEVFFNFNVLNGEIEYFKAGDLNTQSQIFYEGTTSLNLENEEYYFLFTSEDSPNIQKVIDIKKVDSPIEIIFDKKDFATVKGRVRSQDSNLGNVKVSFINAENHGYNFITNIFGEYTAYLPPGNYKVTAEREGYTLKDYEGIIYDFSSKKITHSLDIELVELPSYIQGHVIDENGLAIPFPKVSIKNGSNITRITGDSSGTFKLPVDSGIVTILCQKKGYTQNGTTRKVDRDSIVTNIEVSLIKTRYSITGVVTDDTKALRDVKLQLMGEDYNKIATTTTTENGFFEFYKIPGDQKVFILISENNKIIKKSEIIDLNKDIKNFNILLN